jgi:hypothetical protein
VAAPPSLPGSYASATRWQRVLAIVGIVFAFPFLLTIPGWIGVSHYGKWKRGEGPRPTGYMIWGALGIALLVVSFVAAALTHTPRAGVSPTYQVVSPPPTLAAPIESPGSATPSHPFFQVGDCGRVHNHRVILTPCSSSRATLIVVKTTVRGLSTKCPSGTIVIGHTTITRECWALKP